MRRVISCGTFSASDDGGEYTGVQADLEHGKMAWHPAKFYGPDRFERARRFAERILTAKEIDETQWRVYDPPKRRRSTSA